MKPFRSVKNALGFCLAMVLLLNAQAASRESNPDLLPSIDQVLFSGLNPQAAVDAMTLPKGFEAHLYASEPDISQPIAFCLDERGRIWLAEGQA